MNATRPARICGALALGALALAGPLRAAEMAACDSFAANAQNLIFPVEDSTRSFAEGAVRLIALDTEEPACCSIYLMVLFPAFDEPFLDCRLIVQGMNTGFGAIDMPAITARYVPSVGLQLQVPASEWTGERYLPRPFRLTVNQARGELRLEEGG